MTTTKSRSLAGVALGSATALAATAVPALTIAPAAAAPAAPSRAAAPASAGQHAASRAAYGPGKVTAHTQVVKKKRKKHRTSRPS